jgi:hypothetical protein
MFRRRKLVHDMARQYQQQEDDAKAAARDAVQRVEACFVTDPSDYDVRACIVVRNPSADGSPHVIFKLGWDDGESNDYFFDGDPGYIVREAVPVEIANAAQEAGAWGAPGRVDECEFRKWVFHLSAVALGSVPRGAQGIG